MISYESQEDTQLVLDKWELLLFYREKKQTGEIYVNSVHKIILTQGDLE